jgi:hypothetical protein
VQKRIWVTTEFDVFVDMSTLNHDHLPNVENQVYQSWCLHYTRLSHDALGTVLRSTALLYVLPDAPGLLLSVCEVWGLSGPKSPPRDYEGVPGCFEGSWFGVGSDIGTSSSLAKGMPRHDRYPHCLNGRLIDN